jgi:hypothetical protein
MEDGPSTIIRGSSVSNGGPAMPRLGEVHGWAS